MFGRIALWMDAVARDGPAQMACDEALLAEAETPVLRVFRWKRPWVTAGLFTPWQIAVQTRPDLPWCRRWTGGGVVVHENDFTFSLIAPREDRWAKLRPADSYRELHVHLGLALMPCNPRTTLAATDAPAGQECFAGPVMHDVLVGDRKAAGGAQRRTKRGLLHQGSIQGALLESDFARHLAGALGGEVVEWVPGDGFEERVRLLAEQKYADPEFLQRAAL